MYGLSNILVSTTLRLQSSIVIRQSKILTVVDYVQLYTLLAPPMVPSGTEE